jgi:hypothetical protein
LTNVLLYFGTEEVISKCEIGNIINSNRNIEKFKDKDAIVIKESNQE